jgi:hypothetical protein
VATNISEWENNLQNCVNDIENIQELQTIDNILEISAEHELATYPAAILYHSEKI